MQSICPRRQTFPGTLTVICIKFVSVPRKPGINVIQTPRSRKYGIGEECVYESIMLQAVVISWLTSKASWLSAQWLWKESLRAWFELWVPVQAALQKVHSPSYWLSLQFGAVRVGFSGALSTVSTFVQEASHLFDLVCRPFLMHDISWSQDLLLYFRTAASVTRSAPKFCETFCKLCLGFGIWWRTGDGGICFPCSLPRHSQILKQGWKSYVRPPSQAKMCWRSTILTWQDLFSGGVRYTPLARYQLQAFLESLSMGGASGLERVSMSVPFQFWPWRGTPLKHQ